MSAVAAAIRRKYPVITPNEAGRLIHHCAMGAKQSEIDSVVATGYRAWIDAQLAMPAPRIVNAHLDFPPLTVDDTGSTGNVVMNLSYSSAAQLKMKVVDALSQFFVHNEDPLTYSVTSENKKWWGQMLLDNGMGNFRTLLEDVSKSCIMGWYLTFRGNAKATATSQPDENFARELLQLFSIGLWELFPNGQRKKTGDLSPSDPRYVLNGTEDVPTYTLADVRGLARVFTGWSAASGWSQDISGAPNDMNGPMVQYPQYHETGTKEFLGITIPENTTGQASLTITMDTLFNHPSLAPFFCKQMIQRFTTSNPSPEYVARVSSVFVNNGSGVRGDLPSVWKAILLDQEATSTYTAQLPTWGRVREPWVSLFGRFRGLNAVPNKPSGWPNIGNMHTFGFLSAVTTVGQHPFKPTSVFGFWLPDYQPAGELASLGMASPELQVLGEARITNMLNLTGVYSSLDYPNIGTNWNPEGVPQATLIPDISDWESDARNNVPAMVDRMILLVCGHTVSTATRDTIIARVNSRAAANDWRYRVLIAMTVLVGSPSYLVQR